MILAIDVHYKTDYAKAVAVLFEPGDAAARRTITERIEQVKDYEPGQFYKRELPCILKITEKIDLNLVSLIIVDGHVYTNNEGGLGLGGKLWEALHQKIPVIGVAKTPFLGNKETVQQVLRGQSNNPLYVSAIGIDLNEAALLVKNMKGDFRMPDILKAVDKLTKENF
jgi:deoxyribonuclease V